METRALATRAAFTRCAGAMLIALAASAFFIPFCGAEEAPAPAAVQPAELKPGLVLTLSDAKQNTTLLVPTPHAALLENESLHPSIQPAFRAMWDGFLKIESAGNYQFSGAEKLFVGGAAASGKKFALKPGLYVFHLEWERPAGRARLQITWASDDFAAEPLPSRVLVHNEKSPDLEAFSAIERGRALAEELNCAACHNELSTGAAHENGLLTRKAQDLSAIGSRTNERWIAKWLEDPQNFQNYAAMPALSLSESDRRDIATYLGQMKLPASVKRTTLGGKPVKLGSIEALYESIGCRACHTPERRSIRGMGSKYSEESLLWYLLDPKAAHPGGRMPAMFYIPQSDDAEVARLLLGDAEGKLDTINPLRRKQEEARAIAKYLLLSHVPEFETPIQRGDAAHGEALLASSGCLNCHSHQPSLESRTKAFGKKPATVALQQSPWRVIGPFENGGKCETPFAPEQKIDLDAAYAGADGKSVRWEDGAAFADDAVHNLARHRLNSTIYFYRTIEASEPLSGLLYVGSDDTVTVWVNGVKKFEFMQGRGMPEKKDEVPVVLSKGKNTLLIKVGNQVGDYQFYYKPGEFTPALRSTLAVPALKSAEPKGCLAEGPAGKAPRFTFKNCERADVLAFCASRLKSPDVSPAPAYTTQRQIQQMGCVHCHEWHGTRPVSEVTDPPPMLTGAGEKLRPEWLAEVIGKRKRVRPWMNLRMPHFGDECFPSLARGLQSMDGADFEIPAHVQAAREDMVAGTALISKTDTGLGCIVCHDFRGQKSLGVRGPDMTSMFERLRPEWFRHWMLQPNRLQPGTKMPQFFTDLPSPETDKRLKLIWNTLALGQGMLQPAGLPEQQRNVIVIRDKPQVLRASMPDSSPRSIAVGLPGLIHYCFDAEHCAVRYAWFGEFLDVTGVRSGMGTGPAVPLGQRFFTAPENMPLSIGVAQAQPVRFRGYRLIDGLPEFQFDVDGKAVTQKIERLNEGRGLRYTFTVASGGKPVFFSAGPEKDSAIEYKASAGTWNGATLQIPAADKIEFTLEVRAK
jgi:mono/diheme cytochrome c family protein